MPFGSSRKSGIEPKNLESSRPLCGNFSANRFVIAGGVAIFHLASARVVVVYHPVDRYWFLPKGRKDVNESSQQGAEREGFEESGYRNRLLPIPLKTKQPLPYIVAEEPNSPNVVEPVWLQLVPQTPTSQYLLYWYVAETVPPDVEQSIEESEEKTRKAGETVKYSYPPPFPLDLKLKDRLAVETDNYEPVRHTGTSADSDEALYQPHLMLIDDAIRVLGGAKSVQADVVRLGWMAIQKRFELER